jgi:6-phosphogluconolactonase
VTSEFFVFSDLEDISHMAATIFSCIARTSVASQGVFRVAISGGNTPKRLFLLLGTEYREKVPWEKVEFFWVDERCVPKDHEESNYKSAYDLMLSKLSLPGTHIHMIECEDDPAEAALRYEAEIRKSFGTRDVPSFDFVLLGVGTDGHTASLFPGSEALTEKKRLALAVRGGKPDVWRVTLTLPVINNASQVLFLVAGPSKADVLGDILAGAGKKSKYPAGLVSPLANATWLIDKAAASRLQ